MDEEGGSFKKFKLQDQPILGFSKANKEGTIQPHDDAHVVTLQIAEFGAKMVMIEQGSRVEIMYPNLFNGLGHKLEDLSKYDVPLVGFDGKTIVPRGMIKLLVQMGEEVVNADFIIAEAYSPYMAIL